MKFDRQWAVRDIKEKKLNAFIERTKPSFTQDVLPAIHYGHQRDKTERDPVKMNDHVKVQRGNILQVIYSICLKDLDKQKF